MFVLVDIYTCHLSLADYAHLLTILLKSKPTRNVFALYVSCWAAESSKCIPSLSTCNYFFNSKNLKIPWQHEREKIPLESEASFRSAELYHERITETILFWFPLSSLTVSFWPSWNHLTVHYLTNYYTLTKKGVNIKNKITRRLESSFKWMQMINPICNCKCVHNFFTSPSGQKKNMFIHHYWLRFKSLVTMYRISV